MLGLVADRLWLVKGGNVAPYAHDLEAYRAELLAGEPVEKPAEKQKPKAEKPSREAMQALRSEARKCEERVGKLNEMRDKLAKKLADPELYDRPNEAIVWQKKYAEVMTAVDRAEAMWMSALEKLETAEV